MITRAYLNIIFLYIQIYIFKVDGLYLYSVFLVNLTTKTITLELHSTICNHKHIYIHTLIISSVGKMGLNALPRAH